ncbi:MFS transporter [Brevifollis gellanilyticus]|uniref:Nitrate transporter n=1 Tax=Brevifollis gellanilyticus TaxID=748831 RepID=A0A512M5S3_9BACT|nr:MFS transporter [Brevifollis gellanilyticus]GEP42082.1 nitrate transporter [Brevifollis gellanilyticus]
MKLSALKSSGHWPTLLTSFLYFDVSFMVWTILGALGAQIGQTLGLTPQQKGLMVAVPYLSGAFIRILLGMLVDRIGAKNTGIVAQLIVMAGMTVAWFTGLHQFSHTLMLGVVLGVAGASFAVALPQAGRWYPPQMQGVVMGLAGAGNVGVVIDSLLAPRLAAAYGWPSVFGFALIPLVLVFIAYCVFSKEAPVQVKKKTLKDYVNLLKERDAHWFCFFYTISFGGFSGLAASLIIYFTSEFGLTAVEAGTWAAGCTLIGALGRPVGGAIADRLGGIRALNILYVVAALSLCLAAFAHSIVLCAVGFFLASGAFGMANGSVFQLLPQRFAKDIGVMTGLVGCGGGLGGFMLASSLGYSKGLTGSYLIGILAFSGLCMLALIGLSLVKTRWRTTWGAIAEARI